MDGTIKCSEEHLTALRKNVPGLKDAPDDEVMSRMAQHHETMSAVRNRYLGGDDSRLATMSREQVETAVKDTEAKIEQALKDAAELPALKTQVQQLSALAVKPMDPEAQEMALELVDVLLSRAVELGKISPADKATFAAILGRDKDGKANTLTLSRTQADPKPFAIKIADALCGITSVPLGSQTGVQTMSRNVPGEGDATADKRKKDAADMLNRHLGNGKAA